MGELRFMVLDGLQVWRGGKEVDLGAPRQRAVLAALLLRRRRVVTTAALIDAVWGESAPRSARAALANYVHRLRSVLGPELVGSVTGGYTLKASDEQCDLARFDTEVEVASLLRVEGDLEGAVAVLRDALLLWRGVALAGVPGRYAEAQRGQLAERRLAVVETCLELELELGRHAAVAAELNALIIEHPLRERLRWMAMLALHRGGRNAEALGVFADIRRVLADELGLDPGAELAELHLGILRGDPGLIVPVGSSAAPFRAAAAVGAAGGLASTTPL